MFRHRLSALAVVDGKGNLLGQITDKELIQAALPDFKTLISNLNYSMDIEPFEELLKKEDKIKVKQLYTTDHEVVSRNTKIVEVAAMMLFKDCGGFLSPTEKSWSGYSCAKTSSK